MEKVFLVVTYINGKGHTSQKDSVDVKGCFTNLEDAKRLYELEKQEVSANENEGYEENESMFNYEITNFDADYYAVVKIIVRNIERGENE